jgi:YfiH family protein
MSGFLEHPLLAARGAEHGFGVRGADGPPGLARPRQVHGSAVARARADAAPLGEADAVWSDAPGVAVGVVTADCVPVLLAGEGARIVAAVHAGWRGLAGGVIGAALDALRAAGAPGASLAAAVGPCIGACCYEVDEPVLARLRARFGSALDAHARATRPGHARVALGGLARLELEAALPAGAVGALADACTRCDAARFESYRRDGARAGRLVHWIRVRPRG